MQGGRRDGGNMWLSSRTQRGPVWSDDGTKRLSEQQVSPGRRKYALLYGSEKSYGFTVCTNFCKSDSPPLTCLPFPFLPFPSSHSRCVQGLCVPKGQSYSCQCSEGYQGQYCDRRQEPPACRGQRCGHGECHVSEGGQPICHCQPGYTGPSCDTGKMENVRRRDGGNYDKISTFNLCVLCLC